MNETLLITISVAMVFALARQILSELMRKGPRSWGDTSLMVITEYVYLLAFLSALISLFKMM